MIIEGAKNSNTRVGWGGTKAFTLNSSSGALANFDFFAQNSVQFGRRAAKRRGGKLDISESSGVCWKKSELILNKIPTDCRASLGRTKAERSGGPHSKAFGLLRGKQKARIFVYPVGKRSFSFGARPHFPIPIFSAAEFRASETGAPPKN